MLMALAFCSVWIYNCISRYKVRTSFDVLPHPPISKGLNNEERGPLPLLLDIYAYAYLWPNWLFTSSYMPSPEQI